MTGTEKPKPPRSLLLVYQVIFPVIFPVIFSILFIVNAVDIARGPERGFTYGLYVSEALLFVALAVYVVEFIRRRRARR